MVPVPVRYLPLHSSYAPVPAPILQRSHHRHATHTPHPHAHPVGWAPGSAENCHFTPNRFLPSIGRFVVCYGKPQLTGKTAVALVWLRQTADCCGRGFVGVRIPERFTTAALPPRHTLTFLVVFLPRTHLLLPGCVGALRTTCAHYTAFCGYLYAAQPTRHTSLPFPRVVRFVAAYIAMPAHSHYTLNIPATLQQKDRLEHAFYHI